MGELLVGLTNYFTFYNGERPHQALENQTPDVVYRNASGGGAMRWINMVAHRHSQLRCAPQILRSMKPGWRYQKYRIEKTGAAPFSCVCNRVRLKLMSNLC